MMMAAPPGVELAENQVLVERTHDDLPAATVPGASVLTFVECAAAGPLHQDGEQTQAIGPRGGVVVVLGADRQELARLTVAPGAVRSGTVNFTLAVKRASRQMHFDVRADGEVVRGTDTPPFRLSVPTAGCQAEIGSRPAWLVERDASGRARAIRPAAAEVAGRIDYTFDLMGGFVISN
jgi:hypothetical protein